MSHVTFIDEATSNTKHENKHIKQKNIHSTLVNINKTAIQKNNKNKGNQTKHVSQLFVCFV